MVKLIEVLKRRSELTQGEFCSYWKEKHGPLVLRTLPRLSKYVQNHPVKLSVGEPQFDGIAELWFDDLESFRIAGEWYRSDEGKVLRDDEERFLSKIMGFVAQEEVMK